MNFAQMLKLFTALFVLVGMFSCSTSNEVATNKLFQKRKYNKGWHVNSIPNYSVSHTVNKNKELTQSKATQDSDTSTSQKESRESNLIFTQAETQLVFYPKSKQNLKKHSESTAKKSTSATSLINPSASFSEKFTNNSELFLGQKMKLFDSWLSEEAVQIILAILAILVLIFTGITPLAVWISVGPGHALKTNMTLYVAFWLCALVFAMILLFLFVYTSASAGVAAVVLAILFGLLTVIIGVTAYIHALVSIIRGF
ncbi:MAG: YqaE/Pmp3 family membrane protein [Flavobacteriales bacterium]